MLRVVYAREKENKNRAERENEGGLPNGNGNGRLLSDLTFMDTRTVAHHNVLISQLLAGTLRQARRTFAKHRMRRVRYEQRGFTCDSRQCISSASECSCHRSDRRY